jgi:hypothetical protein
VLDAAYEVVKYRNGFVLDPKTPDEKSKQAQEMALLRRRSRIKHVSTPPVISAPEPPEEAHQTARVVFGAGVMDQPKRAASNQGRSRLLIQDLAIRGSLHDLLDRQVGYAPDSAIVLPEIRLRLRPQLLDNARRRTRWHDVVMIEQLDIVKIVSLQPLERWIRKPSWRVAVSGGRVRDLGCDTWTCTALHLSGGVGLTVASHLLQKEVFYAMIDLHTWAGPAFAPNYRIGSAAALGLLVDVTPWWRMHGEAAYRFDFLGDVRQGRRVLSITAGMNFALSRDVALRLSGRQERKSREALLSGMLYF